MGGKINMGFLDNIKKQSKTAAGAFGSAASATYNNAAVMKQAQDEINAIQREINALQVEIDNACTQIGRKYIEYVLETKDIPEIGAGDILVVVDSKMERKAELNEQLIEKQKRLNDQLDMQEKSKLESEFIAEKDKLDRALAMAVISQSEYDVKLKELKAPIEHFDDIKRINQQKEMGLITAAERDAKIEAIIKS